MRQWWEEFKVSASNFLDSRGLCRQWRDENTWVSKKLTNWAWEIWIGFKFNPGHMSDPYLTVTKEGVSDAQN